MDVRACCRVRERHDVDLILGQGMLAVGEVIQFVRESIICGYSKKPSRRVLLIGHGRD